MTGTQPLWHLQVNPDIRKEKWTADEDRLLASLVAEHGNRWADIARQYAPPEVHGHSSYFPLKALESQIQIFMTSFAFRLRLAFFVQHAWTNRPTVHG